MADLDVDQLQEVKEVYQYFDSDGNGITSEKLKVLTE